MKNVQFSDIEIENCLDIVVAILNLGNVEFGLVSDSQCGPTGDSKNLVKDSAKLLGVDIKSLITAMTMKKTVVMKEEMLTELSLEQSYMARNALCKDLYGNMFSWII